MTTKDEALKMAIEALKTAEIQSEYDGLSNLIFKAIQACKEALEQHQEEVPKGVLQAIDKYGLSLLKTAHGFELRKLGKTEASSIVEQPAQEPVAWMHRHAGEITEFNDFQSCQYCEPLYTHPAPPCQECENLKHDLEGYMEANKALINREWQGLTAQEIASIPLNEYTVQTVERMLKEKNNV